MRPSRCQTHPDQTDRTYSKVERQSVALCGQKFGVVNPTLPRDEITVTCEDGMIQEARLCLTKNLKPRRCGADVIRDCRLKDAVMEPVR